MPAPKGNQNAQKHGLHCRAFLATGNAPKGLAYSFSLIRQLRQALVDAVRDRHGEVSLAHDLLVHSAVRHESRAVIFQTWLRRASDLTVPEKVGILREIGNATDSRDRCVKQLDLDRRQLAQDFDRVLDAAYFGSAAPTPATEGTSDDRPPETTG